LFLTKPKTDCWWVSLWGTSDFFCCFCSHYFKCPAGVEAEAP